MKKTFYLVLTVGCVWMLGSFASTLNAMENAPFSVGSKTLFIHDESRPYDQVAGVEVGIRSLLTEVWYPVAHEQITKSGLRKATYGDYSFGDKEVHRLMLTNTTFFHLTPESVLDGISQKDIDTAIDELFDRPRGSYLEAPVAVSGNKLPVVVMTHGDAGSRYNMETACEYLAAHGYFVIAPEHTGNTPFAFSIHDPEIDGKLADVKPLLNKDGTYGPADKYGQTYTPLIRNREDPQAMVNLDNSLLERVNDLRAVLAELELMNESGEFKGLLDLKNIGLMGRSFGGTTTLAALGLEPKFTAGVSIVPLVMPDVRSQVPMSLLKKDDQESVLLAAEGDSVLHKIIKPTLLLSGAEDALIIGAGAGFAKMMGGTEPSADNPLPALRASYEESKQPVIWGLLNDSNHSSFGVSGGYWWPAMKPSSQQRFFTPEESFKLIDVELAHNIQKQKVLQFFDYFIRNQSGARNRLINNEFSEQGLIYEARNF